MTIEEKRIKRRALWFSCMGPTFMASMMQWTASTGSKQHTSQVCSSYSQSPLICDTIANPLRRLGYPPCHLSSTFAAPFAAP